MAGSADAADELLLVHEQLPRLELQAGRGDAHQHGGAACCHPEVATARRGQNLLHRRLDADAIEGVVGAADGLAAHGVATLAHGERANGLDRVDLRGVDAVGRAEGPGELELRLVEVDGDDRVRSHPAGRDHGTEAHAAHPEDRHALAPLNACGVVDGARARHDGTADDRGDVVAGRLGHLHHVLLVGDGGVRPREDIACGDLASSAQLQRDRFGRSVRVRRVARDPGQEDLVAFPDVAHLPACR